MKKAIIGSTIRRREQEKLYNGKTGVESKIEYQEKSTNNKTEKEYLSKWKR
jgi:hypothetical protein